MRFGSLKYQVTPYRAYPLFCKLIRQPLARAFALGGLRLHDEKRSAWAYWPYMRVLFVFAEAALDAGRQQRQMNYVTYYLISCGMYHMRKTLGFCCRKAEI